MPVPPFAVKRLIPPGSSDPRIEPRVAVLHVDAGNAGSLYDYFAHRSGGIESHFHVRSDGVIECYRDTNYQADANLAANDFGISIETQGYGEGTWNAAQLGSIKRLLVWLNDVHPAIKLQKCDGPYGSGVGYHIQFGSPGPWTPVSKSCPGPNRIRQYNDVIVPWLRSGAKEDYMSTDAAKQQLDSIEAKLDNLAKKSRERDLRIADRIAKKVGKTRQDILAAIAEDDEAQGA